MRDDRAIHRRTAVASEARSNVEERPFKCRVKQQNVEERPFKGRVKQQKKD